MPNPPFAAARPNKIMSSRLMSMKFMQRGAAASVQTQTQTQPDPDISKNKRQKTDLQAVKAAVEAEEAMIEKALDRHAFEVAETKWVLSSSSSATPLQRARDEHDHQDGGGRKIENLRVLMAGYSEIENDGSNDVLQEQWVPAEMGRRRYGGLKKRQKAANGYSSTSTSNASEGENEEYEDRDGPASDLIRPAKSDVLQIQRAELKTQKKDEKANAAQLADRLKNEVVKLKKMSSISGGGARSRVSQPCYTCGEEGHKARACPKNPNGKRIRERGGGGGGGADGGFSKRSKMGY